MRKHSLMVLRLVLGLSSLAASPTNAATIQYDFAGTVIGACCALPPGSMGSSFTPGATFSGQFKYVQENGAVIAANTDQAVWDLTAGSAISISTASETLTTSGNYVEMAVLATPGGEWLILAVNAPSFPSGSFSPGVWALGLDFDNNFQPNDVFSDTAIPGADLTLEMFDTGRIYMSVYGPPGFGNPWEIPLEVTSLTGHVVPEPSSVSFVGLFLLSVRLAQRALRR